MLVSNSAKFVIKLKKIIAKFWYKKYVTKNPKSMLYKSPKFYCKTISIKNPKIFA